MEKDPKTSMADAELRTKYRKDVALSERAETQGLSLRDYTPARVALARTGVSLATAEILDFQLAHAQARDAVHAVLDCAGLADRLRSQIPGFEGQIVLLSSAAPDRVSYLRRPDLGRSLTKSSAGRLERSPCDVVIVIADGLSATAVERHTVPLLAALLPSLRRRDVTVGPICIASQARVAIADEIGALLHARLSIILIGERPGLSCADSLGAYITWAPSPGRTDAERNCVSNIHGGGLDYAEAAAKIGFYCQEALRRRLTGTSLKEPSQPSLQS
jgi:ethanolamine ammonia-lyase small subunit